MASFSNDQDRLQAYCTAVRTMRRGKFSVRFPVGQRSEGPFDILGQELTLLAQWLDQRFAQFHKLQDVAAEMGGGLFTDNVLERVYNAFSALIPYDRIGYALLSNDGETLMAQWSKSAYPGEKRIARGFSSRMTGSSLASILTTGQPRILNDLESYLEAHPDSVSTQMIVAEGIRSNLTCPLVAEGKPVGFLFFSSREKNTYRDVHQDIFLQIAAQLSVLIEKSRLYQQIFELNQQLIETQRDLKERSTHDALTGLLNRGAILDQLQVRLSAEGGGARNLAVIMADVDHFKHVNDACGHLGGDAVLRAVAGAIGETLRGIDKVGRYGGEEFLVVLQDTGLEGALHAAERIREAVAALKVWHDGRPIRVTLSQGVALCEDCGDAMDPLLGRADAALYQAKQQGRNRVCLAHAYGLPA
jgi:diguanylate cyclase (GGDEF)-like protein